jgi:hypothetical protein
VRYRWHPWFGRTVWVHRTRAFEDQQIVRCGLTPDLDAHAIEIPMWMFDAGTCGHMHASNEPVVSMEALRELKSLLTHARHPLSAADPVLQAGHRDLSSTGGAHANRFEVAAWGDAIDAVSTASQRAGLGVDANRSPTAGAAPDGTHASRARRSPVRRSSASGAPR